MGQDIGKECGCGFGESEEIQEAQQLQAQYKSDTLANAAPQAAAKGAETSAAARASAEAQQSSRWSQDAEDGGGFYVPPPPVSDSSPAKAVAKPAAAPPPKAPEPRAPAASAVASAPVLADILKDLEAAEQAGYSALWKGFAGGKATIGPDNAELRRAVCTHSGILSDDLDVELLKICDNETFTIDCDNFVLLMQMNPVAESDVISGFLGLQSEDEAAGIASDTCRVGLAEWLSRQNWRAISEDDYSRVLDYTMRSCAPIVDMEQWTGLCKTAARICRVYRLS
eukprot:TRINITY_DN112450_c0_g1_i1.p1 TRINITY_DN112450_c0_g1~~TRINITY_DN112450_c0_g1_i1.p1  ORF type:complete len:283 (-),score=67.42 TRINITY_DN112450_c0_g1_i1:108-956(-)